MNRQPAILLCAALACALPSCITLTAEVDLPGGGQSGGLSGKIGGSWQWPQPRAAADTLPADAVAVGKNPVLPLP